VKTWIYRGLFGEEVLDTDVRPGGPIRRGRR
jgi:small subunit ribosomal protein S3